MAAHLVCYAGIARPGHSYSMSSSYWVNTGTEPETFVFRADPPAAASWIKMAESSVTLDPGQAVSIPVTLTVPVGAAKGIYGARLEASGAEESVEFGVGVRPGCAGPAAPPLVPGGGRGFPLPLWVVTGLLLAAALLTWLARQRRTDCDHPVHRLRGGKWQSLAEFRHADPRQMVASALAASSGTCCRTRSRGLPDWLPEQPVRRFNALPSLLPGRRRRLRRPHHQLVG